MGLSLKTIQFALPTYRSVIANATTQLIQSGTLYTPENTPSTPITIKSFTVEIGFQDVITATGGTIGEHRCGLKLGGAAVNTITQTDDIVHSGEQLGGVLGPFDFTSYAIANYGTSTSQSYEVYVYFDQITGTTLGMNNVNALINLTYEYDNTSVTQIKTVRIPFESKVSGLANVQEEIGTNQWPKLDEFLVEDDVVIRDYFLVVEGNQATVSTTDTTVSFKVGTEAQHNTGLMERSQASDIFTRYIWSRTYDYPNTGSAYPFYAWASTANFYPMLTYTLFVTYEFNHSTSTSSLNSIYIPIELESPLGDNLYPSRFETTITVQEPGTLQLKHSAVRLNYNTTATTAGGIFIKVGNQGYKQYIDYSGVACGMYSLQQRIDAGSSQGAYGTFARGRNTFTIDLYRLSTLTADPTNLNGYILLNYISGVASEGISAHSHTIFQNLYRWNALLSDKLITNPFALTIPETNYWINAIGIISIFWDASSINALTADVEVKPGESKGSGFIDLYTDAVQTDAERQCSIIWMKCRDVFKRYPGDTDTERIDVQIPRVYRFFTPGTTARGLYLFMTYHTISYPITGSVKNYSGDGTGITVSVFRAHDDEKVLSLTTGISGSFSGSWYDNTEDIYVVVREDNNHVGRSANGKV